MARLQVHGHRLRIGQGQAGRGCPDVPGHLSDANIEGDMRMLFLGDADRVVQGGRDMRRAANQDVAEVFHLWRFLREPGRGHHAETMGQGQGDPQTAEQPAAKARRLAADAQDGRIGGFPAEVDQQRHRRLQPGFGESHVHILIGVRFGGYGNALEPRNLLVEGAGDEFIVGAHDDAGRESRHEWMPLAILHQHSLGAEDIHPGELPQAAERGAVTGEMDAAGISYLSPVRKALGNAEGVNVADDLVGIEEVVADGGVGEKLALGAIDDVGCGRDKPAGITFERLVLGVELPRDEHGNDEEAANNEFVESF